MKHERFRADLFHRLNVYPIDVPPLREHPEDIPLIAGRYCEVIQRQLGCGPVRFRSDTFQALKAYAWPGNVRELENAIARAILRASGDHSAGDLVVVSPHHFGGGRFSPENSIERGSQTGVGDSPVVKPLRAAVDDLQRDLIRAALKNSGGNWAAAARALGVNRSNLHKLAKRLGIKDTPASVDAETRLSERHVGRAERSGIPAIARSLAHVFRPRRLPPGRLRRSGLFDYPPASIFSCKEHTAFRTKHIGPLETPSPGEVNMKITLIRLFKALLGAFLALGFLVPHAASAVLKEDGQTFLVDRTGECWDITQAVSIGFDPDYFEFGLGRHAFDPLDDTHWQSSSKQNASGMRVIGVVGKGDAHAYSVNKLRHHETANTFLGSEAIVAGY